MSEVEYTINDDEMECPYCGAKYQPEGEDYSEDERVEECGECGKKYKACQCFTVDHRAEPDCELNGESHQWKPEPLGDGRFHDFCSICGKCRQSSDHG